jgi:hypothetical protein
MSSLKTQFVVLSLTFKSSLMQLFLTFNLSFGYITKNWAIFFHTSGHSALTSGFSGKKLFQCKYVCFTAMASSAYLLLSRKAACQHLSK